MTTLVSVLLPVYNAKEYVEAAIASILTQDYANMEVIVIDDGSTDGSQDILRRMAAEDLRIRLITRENRGLVASLNEGLDIAKGDLIARMDADDIAYPSRISTQVKAFEANPDLCVVGMGADLLFPDNFVLRNPGPLFGTQEIRTQNMFHPMFVHPTVMLNNRIMQAEGLRYNPRYPRCEDADLWRRIIPNHQSMLLPEIGLAWRQTNTSIRALHFREQCIDGFAIFAELLNKAGVTRDLSIFSVLSAGNGKPQKLQLLELTESLKAIYALKSKFHDTEHAFDRGFQGLIANTLEAASFFSDLPAVITAITQAGYGDFIGKRYKVQAALTKLSSPRIALKVMSKIRATSRRLKGSKLTDLVQLPETVRQYLYDN